MLPLIAARDREERTRILAGKSEATAQAARENPSQIATISSSINLPETETLPLPPPLPSPNSSRLPANDLPKTGPDRSDEPESVGLLGHLLLFSELMAVPVLTRRLCRRSLQNLQG